MGQVFSQWFCGLCGSVPMCTQTMYPLVRISLLPRFLLRIHPRLPSTDVLEQNRPARHRHPRLVEPVGPARLMRREERLLEILFSVYHELLPIVVLDDLLPLYLHHLPVEVL